VSAQASKEIMDIKFAKAVGIYIGGAILVIHRK
jgi:hypothetical protein